MTLRDQLNDLHFALTVASTPDQVRLVGLAAASESSLAGRSIKEASASSSLLQYVVRGPAGVVQMGLINVAMTPVGVDALSVQLTVPSVLTTRTAILLIPVTTKRAPAKNAIARFSMTMQIGLRNLGAAPTQSMLSAVSSPPLEVAEADDADGLLVVATNERSSLVRRTGIAAGDRLVLLNGEPATDKQAVEAAIMAGGRITLGWIQDGERKERTLIV